MRSVTYSMGLSLDGYIARPDGGFDWAAPDEEVFRFVTDELRQVGVHLLGRGGLAEEIERLRAEPAAEGNIAIGGAALAAEAAALDLIDEYHARVHPVLAGGGTPFFPQRGRQVDLDLVEARTFGSGVACLRYRVVRQVAAPAGGEIRSAGR